MRALDRLVLLGRFGAPHGVRGEIRVQSFTGEPEAIGAYGTLTNARRTATFGFERLRPLKNDMLVAKLCGVDTREAAAALTGIEIFARRESLPAPSEDEFYFDDLLGLEAVTPEGQSLGRVSALANYGAGDLLEIQSDGREDAVLVPFTKAVAPTIDFERGRIVIAPPIEVD